MGDTTTIRIRRETWHRLHELKGPGVSHDDVIQRLLEEVEGDSRGTTADA
jgi:predicted CopG family antitoxin